jgi:hypothetical protein
LKGLKGLRRLKKINFNCFNPFNYFNPLNLNSNQFAFAAVAFLVLAGLDLPKEPLKILPFLVFLSPLPIVFEF